MSGSNCTDLDHCECVDALYKRIAELEAALTDITELYYPAEIHRKALKYIKNEGGRMGCLESGDDCQRVAEKALSDAKLQEKGE